MLTGSAVRVPRPRCPPPLAACGRGFNRAGRIYSSKVNSQLGFFLFFLSFFLFLEAGSISRHRLRRSRSHDSSQSIGLQFRRACSRRERNDQRKRSFQGKNTAKTCGLGRRRRSGRWEGPPLLKATPRGAITALLSITTHNSRQRPIFETSVAVIQMQLSHWQPLVNSTGPKLELRNNKFKGLFCCRQNPAHFKLQTKKTRKVA